MEAIARREAIAPVLRSNAARMDCKVGTGEAKGRKVALHAQKPCDILLSVPFFTHIFRQPLVFQVTLSTGQPLERPGCLPSATGQSPPDVTASGRFMVCVANLRAMASNLVAMASTVPQGLLKLASLVPGSVSRTPHRSEQHPGGVSAKTRSCWHVMVF